MSPIDRKALKAKMREQEMEKYKAVKAVVFPLPDLRGPEGNAFVLLGMAHQLMKAQGITEAMYQEFHSQATSGNYEHLLETIQKWFTVAVPVVQYAPLEGSILDIPRTATIDGVADDDEDEDGDDDAGKLCVECGEANPQHAMTCIHHPEYVSPEQAAAAQDEALKALEAMGIIRRKNQEEQEDDG